MFRLLGVKTLAHSLLELFVDLAVLLSSSVFTSLAGGIVLLGLWSGSTALPASVALVASVILFATLSASGNLKSAGRLIAGIFVVLAISSSTTCIALAGPASSTASTTSLSLAIGSLSLVSFLALVVVSGGTSSTGSGYFVSQLPLVLVAVVTVKEDFLLSILAVQTLTGFLHVYAVAVAARSGTSSGILVLQVLVKSLVLFALSSLSSGSGSFSVDWSTASGVGIVGTWSLLLAAVAVIPALSSTESLWLLAVGSTSLLVITASGTGSGIFSLFLISYNLSFLLVVSLGGNNTAVDSAIVLLVVGGFPVTCVGLLKLALAISTSLSLSGILASVFLLLFLLGPAAVAIVFVSSAGLRSSASSSVSTSSKSATWLLAVS